MIGWATAENFTEAVTLEYGFGTAEPNSSDGVLANDLLEKVDGLHVAEVDRSTRT